MTEESIKQALTVIGWTNVVVLPQTPPSWFRVTVDGYSFDFGENNNGISHKFWIALNNDSKVLQYFNKEEDVFAHIASTIVKEKLAVAVKTPIDVLKEKLGKIKNRTQSQNVTCSEIAPFLEFLVSKFDVVSNFGLKEKKQ